MAASLSLYVSCETEQIIRLLEPKAVELWPFKFTCVAYIKPWCVTKTTVTVHYDQQTRRLMSSIPKRSFRYCSLPTFPCHQLNVATLGAHFGCCMRPPTCKPDALTFVDDTHHDPAKAKTGPQKLQWYQHACRHCSNGRICFTAHSQNGMHRRDADL